MKKILLLSGATLFVFIIATLIQIYVPRTTGAPPYVIEDLEPPETDRYAWIRNWVRPDGPPKVGLQVGHWQLDNLPQELERLRDNTGASAAGVDEWEVNLAIAQAVKEILESKGIIVDILPAAVPQGYWADVFVAIHADGNLDTNTRGYKAASPWRDFSGGAKQLVTDIEKSYEETTGLPRDPLITRNMTGYYAFAWWRYDHSVHPRTASAILETGFLTNWQDRQIIVEQPELAAQGLVNGIISYLEEKVLL
ncbi:N-acetylmuramoyl-L-alanine amidase [Candidatus Microgenomates bacterium]|nr:MAG: N-acetylmuramoyl-L-alanine amidase [Candidatus Microgenomates bacterium]